MTNKVYNKKGKVNHSHPLSPDHHLSLFLPTAIFALAASLPLHDKEVLTYFLSCPGPGCGVDLVTSRSSLRRRMYHAPQFGCSCFGCYVSFWSRWDSSNNRHVIDEIIEAFEEHERRVASAATRGRARQGRRGRKKRGEGESRKDGTKRAEPVEEEEEEEEEGVAGEYGSSSGEEEVERVVVGRIGTTIGYKIWNFLDRITM